MIWIFWTVVGIAAMVLWMGRQLDKRFVRQMMLARNAMDQARTSKELLLVMEHLSMVEIEYGMFDRYHREIRGLRAAVAGRIREFRHAE